MNTSKRQAEGPLVIAIDSSTTATKAIVVDTAGNIWHTAKSEIDMITPAMDFYEHDPRQWWQTTKEAIGKVIAELSPADRERVAGIGITNQRESFAPFKADGTPLRNGILWLDGRATAQVEKYGSKRNHELSGRPAGITPSFYKLAWLKDNEPETLAAADYITDVHGYLTFMMTGEWISSTASSDSLSLFDIQTRTWAPELLEACGVREEQMARLVPPSYEMAPIRAELTSEWGLPRPIPVFAGIGDGQSAGIGSASVRGDIAFLNLGTAVVAGVDSSHYKVDPVWRTEVSGIADHYVFELVQNSGSYLAGWFRGALGNPELGSAPDPELEAAAAALAPGAEGLVTLPYWNAVQSPYWDDLARGAVVGWRGTHGRAHMYRSILESIGYEMRLNMNFLEEGTGVKITELRGMGGGTRSPLWRQLMADITGVPIRICLEDEISAMGAAMLAMAGVGTFGDHNVQAAAEAMAQFGDLVEPEASVKARYDEIGAIQRELYPALKGVFEKLHALSSPQV